MNILLMHSQDKVDFINLNVYVDSIDNDQVYEKLKIKISRDFDIFLPEESISSFIFLGLGNEWKRGFKVKITRKDFIETHILQFRTGIGLIDFIIIILFQFIYLPKLLRERRNSIIYAPTPYTGLAAALLKKLYSKRLKAYLYTRVQGDTTSKLINVHSSKLKAFLLRGTEKFVLKNSDIVLPMGDFTRKLAIKYGVKEGHIVVLPFPVRDLPEVRPFRKDLVEKLRHKFHSRQIALCVARVEMEKGIHHLIRAFPRVLENHPDAKLIIVGDGKSRKYMEDLSQQIGLDGKVFFEGWIDHKDIFTYYEISDLVVLPSIWEEGLGMVLVEAGLFKRPVIGSNLGGITDIVQDGHNGFLVSRGDEKSLADRITVLLNDEEMRKRFGEAGYKIAREYLSSREKALIEIRNRTLKFFKNGIR